MSFEQSVQIIKMDFGFKIFPEKGYIYIPFFDLS